MGWFDTQLRQRRKKDRETFEDAFLGIAGAVMGKRLVSALEKHEAANSAIDEILRYYCIKSRTDEFPASVKTVEEQIEYRLRPYGVMHREVMLGKGWYKCAAGAMLGTLKADGSAVALIPGSFSGYSFYDFRTGKRVKLNRKTEALLDEQATLFYQPLPMRKLAVKDLLAYMKDLFTFSDVFLVVGIAALTALLGLLSPVFTKWLFGPVLESGSIKVLLSLTVFVVCFALTKMLVGIYKQLVNTKILIKQDVAVQAAVMARLMALPPSFFKKYGAGELTQRATYVQSLCSIIFTSIGDVGLTSIFSLIYIGQIFAYAPPLVLPSLAIILVTAAVTLVTAVTQMKITRESMLVGTKESGMSYAMITGIQKIKLAGAEKRMFSRWAKLYSKSAALDYNPPLFIKISPAINTAITLIGTFVLYFIAVDRGIPVADYYAFSASYALVSAAFTSLASVATTVAFIRPILEMVKPILEAEPEVSEGKRIVTELRGGIEFNNVCFRYDEASQNVINGLSLKIKPGEYVAIVGKTGCGKSTLVRLLLGFEKAQKGSVFYDGRDINSLDLRSLRKKIGVVTQNGKLFLGDIYSNIVISAPELTLDDAWRAAEIASVADDIKQMPMGMNTLISDGQGGISGGQKQRLLIARAVAPNPKILIFDEATSALDNVTQKRVSEAIDGLGCTRIVIAHRLSTIKHCDRIIVLDEGNIVEDGTYEELTAKGGFFADLVARQRIDNED